MISLLLILLLEQRNYYDIPIELVSKSKRTHICVIAPIVYKRKQQDGDWHLTLAKTIKEIEHKLVIEIIPMIPLEVPSKGQIVKACGIRRFDEHHKWMEIHPVETIEVIK